ALAHEAAAALDPLPLRDPARLHRDERADAVPIGSVRAPPRGPAPIDPLRARGPAPRFAPPPRLRRPPPYDQLHLQPVVLMSLFIAPQPRPAVVLEDEDIRVAVVVVVAPGAAAQDIAAAQRLAGPLAHLREAAIALVVEEQGSLFVGDTRVVMVRE